jgi:hypothetical protein
MTCEECPISLVCFAGQLTRADKPMPETYLCPYCGNFRTPAFEEDETSDAVRTGLTGFQCQERRMDEVMKKAWKHRSLGADGVGRHYRYNDVQLSKSPQDNDVISALRVDDPGPGEKLWIKPCSFCRH